MLHRSPSAHQFGIHFQSCRAVLFCVAVLSVLLGLVGGALRGEVSYENTQDMKVLGFLWDGGPLVPGRENRSHEAAGEVEVAGTHPRHEVVSNENESGCPAAPPTGGSAMLHHRFSGESADDYQYRYDRKKNKSCQVEPGSTAPRDKKRGRIQDSKDGSHENQRKQSAAAKRRFIRASLWAKQHKNEIPVAADLDEHQRVVLCQERKFRLRRTKDGGGFDCEVNFNVAEESGLLLEPTPDQRLVAEPFMDGEEIDEGRAAERAKADVAHREWLQKAISLLTRQQRRAIQLSLERNSRGEVNDLKNIAKKMGIAIRAVQKLLASARRRLKEMAFNHDVEALDKVSSDSPTSPVIESPVDAPEDVEKQTSET